MNLLNNNLLNSIVSYKDCFYYIDKLYKTNGVNGRVNGLEIYEVSGKENVLHVSRIEGI